MNLPGLDKIKKILQGSDNPGKKADAVPKSSSTGPSPVQGPSNPAKPPVIKNKKPVNNPPVIFDKISRFFMDYTGKATKSKNKQKSIPHGDVPPGMTSQTVKPGPDANKGEGPKDLSLNETISGLVHRGKKEEIKPTSDIKTGELSAATMGAGGAVQKSPETVPFEQELIDRKKTSTLDPLKRAYHVDDGSIKKEKAKEEKALKKGRKPRKIIATYDFSRDGPLVEAECPPGYREIENYWVDAGESIVVIALNEKTNQNEYLLYEPVLSEFQYELIERVHADLRNILILDEDELVRDKRELLLEKMGDLFHEYGISPDQTTLYKLQYYLVRNFLGWGRIEALMKDPYIEDISCDGTMIPLFLYHRKYRNIKTNINFKAEVLDSLAITLAQRSGKHISTGSPIIDATLPDGSRLQLTFGKEVTTRGTSFTIRKFREEPFSPVELLENGTFNEDQLVYFWMAIENNKSLLFIGGTASGKTTSLNAASLFIPPMAKVVSIEDTREITLYHENWIASVTRDSIAEGASQISMFDLLRAAMRQRPEYILVGEVRGVEAQTLFQAMNTGHTTFSTLHAGNVDAAIHRLESEPLNVPRNMLQALNVISVQALVYRGQERIRRVQEIVEIAGADPTTGSLRVNTVFTYDPVADKFTYHGRSQVYADIAEKRGWSREQLEDEIKIRRIILRSMKEQGIIDYITVSQLFQAYNIDPAGVIEAIGDLKTYLKRGS